MESTFIPVFATVRRLALPVELEQRSRSPSVFKTDRIPIRYNTQPVSCYIEARIAGTLACGCLFPLATDPDDSSLSSRACRNS